uniref:Uncharacterized protein n=1 Tax=viral metagenome TaxID=1070528 RepID=A0A6C0H6C2_9ZZZZ
MKNIIQQFIFIFYNFSKRMKNIIQQFIFIFVKIAKE